MKRILIVVFIGFNILLLFGVGGLLALWEFHPIPPGGALYRIQDTTEQWRLALTPSLARRAEISMDLAERRLANLAKAQSDKRVDAAALAVGNALDEAARHVGRVPKTRQAPLWERFDGLLEKTEIVVQGLQAVEARASIATLAHRIDALLIAASSEELLAVAPPSNSLRDALAIPFLSGEVEHSAYPLTGAHRDIECEACHREGKYAGTSNECSLCHELPDNPLYANHFDGACADCHIVDHWEPYRFDHAEVVECQSCHADHTPRDHYALGKPGMDRWAASLAPNVPHELASGQMGDACLLCHSSTEDWEQISFEHEDLTDCESCHRADTPFRHYEGLCADCHGTQDWQMIEYDHVNADQCRSCHLDDTPPQHYSRGESSLLYAAWLPGRATRPLLAGLQAPASCSNCHLDTEDWNMVSFDHSGYADCASCHAPADLPADHYAGQCSDCHDRVAWEHSFFSHAGYTDCESCHVPDDVPLAHFDGLCASCHSTDNWSAILFEHGDDSNCERCHAAELPTRHYDGACATCHQVTDWELALIAHDDTMDCASCHSQVDHYAGQCSECHTVTDWNNVRFAHDGRRDCVTCHSEDIPRGHNDTRCAKCHSTYDWGSGNPNHIGSVNCETCHSAPSGHYPGECSTCHSTATWLETLIVHTPSSDCVSCHAAPVGHYGGQCSSCHSLTDWQVTAVDHSGLVDCALCHAAPAGHYGGQCSQCHNTDNWDVIAIDHGGLVDCASCHEAPAGHYGGQCSECHNTDNWQVAVFSHDDLADCTSCHEAPDGHYTGECSACHNTTSWLVEEFSHDGLVDCVSCHPAPTGHWTGVCSKCHNTSSWSDYKFDHTGFTSCNSCHSADRPANHPRGQCSKCHTVWSWDAIATTAPTPTATQAPADEPVVPAAIETPEEELPGDLPTATEEPKVVESPAPTVAPIAVAPVATPTPTIAAPLPVAPAPTPVPAADTPTPTSTVELPEPAAMP